MASYGYVFICPFNLDSLPPTYSIMPWISPDAPDRLPINIINLRMNHSTNEKRMSRLKRLVSKMIPWWYHGKHFPVHFEKRKWFSPFSALFSRHDFASAVCVTCRWWFILSQEKHSDSCETAEYIYSEILLSSVCLWMNAEERNSRKQVKMKVIPALKSWAVKQTFVFRYSCYFITCSSLGCLFSFIDLNDVDVDCSHRWSVRSCSSEMEDRALISSHKGL